MTAIAQPPWAAPPRRWGPGRIVALVLGIVLVLPGIGLLAGGGALLWVDRSSRTSDGFVLSGTHHFTAPGYALTSDTLDLSTGARWLPVSSALGRARVEVTADAGKDVFVGIAPVDRARSYLFGVGHTVVRDIGASSTAADLATVSGGPPPGPPGAQSFWVARTSGTGTQTLTWLPADGSWMLVVMASDGSAGLSVQARAGATVPSLTGISWAVLGGGLALTVVGVLLVVLAARRRPGPAAPPADPAEPGRSPAAWIPEPRQGAADARDPVPHERSQWRPPESSS